MEQNLKDFFEKREKELTEQIKIAEKEQKEFGYDISIAFEHYWGRRAELKYIKQKLEKGENI